MGSSGVDGCGWASALWPAGFCSLSTSEAFLWVLVFFDVVVVVLVAPAFLVDDHAAGAGGGEPSFSDDVGVVVLVA
jgi:hypothetical protein